MALSDPITPKQISYIESMLIDLAIYDKRKAYYKDKIGNEDISAWDRADASRFIDYCKVMLREKKAAEVVDRPAISDGNIVDLPESAYKLYPLDESDEPDDEEDKFWK